MVKDKYIALACRLFCLLFIFAGLLAQMGIFNGNINFKLFMYYTIQSNLLALILFGMLSYKTISDIHKNGNAGSAGYFSRFEMVCVINILLTLVVYWALLAPGASNMEDMKLWSFTNLAVHLFTPLMCLIDYFLFSQPGRLKYRDVYFVLIFPFFYLLFTTIAGLLGYVYRISNVDGRAIRFPYFFFDWDEVGAAALIYIFVLVVFFLILSNILYLIDRKRIKKIVVK